MVAAQQIIGMEERARIGREKTVIQTTLVFAHGLIGAVR